MGKGIFALVCILTGTSTVSGGQAGLAADANRVIVFVQNDVAPTDVVSRAKFLASDLFDRVNVKIEWHCGKPRGEGADNAIAVELYLPYDGHPHPIAYALPYEGVHIRVFYDRVQYQSNPAALLAHVLVHEITHILQGADHHSLTGIMKERWSIADIDKMSSRTLMFTEADVLLLQKGLAIRAQRAGLAGNQTGF